MVKCKSDISTHVLVKVDDHEFKILLVEDNIQVMLKGCLHINGLYQKSPYGKTYEIIDHIPLDDPDCFNKVVRDVRHKWFLDIRTE